MAAAVGAGAGVGTGAGVETAASAGVGGGVVAGTAVEVGMGEGFGGAAGPGLTNVGGNEACSRAGAASTRAVATRFPMSGARTTISSPLGWNSGSTDWETMESAIPAWLSSAAMTGPSGVTAPGSSVAWEGGSGVRPGKGPDQVCGLGRIIRAPSLASVVGGNGSEYGVGIGIGTTSRLGCACGPESDEVLGDIPASCWPCRPMSASSMPQPSDSKNAAAAIRSKAQT